MISIFNINTMLRQSDIGKLSRLMGQRRKLRKVKQKQSKFNLKKKQDPGNGTSTIFKSLKISYTTHSHKRGNKMNLRVTDNFTKVRA